MIFSLLQRARRRFLWNEVIAQFAFAAALLLGGVVLLLLLGTQVLDWRLIVAVCLAGFGVALYRTLKRIPGDYKMAAMLDRRAGLFDALSTAYFFADPAKAEKTAPAVHAAQLTYAESLVPSVDLESAIPFRFPRAFYAMGVLGLLASSLFALRYGSQKQLDWKPPISQLLIETLGLKDPEAKQLAKKKSEERKPAELFDETGNPLPRSEQKKATDLDKAPANALDSVGEPNVNNEKADGASAKGGDGKSEGSDKTGAEQGESEKADSGTPQAGKNGSDNPSGSQDGPQQGEQAAGQKSAGDNNSLLSKMKDAMSNLLSKAKPQQNNSDAQKQSAGQQNSQKAQGQQKSGEKGSQSQNQQGDSQEAADGQQGEQPGESDNAQDSQGKGSGKSSEQQAAAQPGSGVGKQDGAKDVKAAEQKAAMGKLSEIIGKRSANVSGEMMLDVQSGPQQLRTSYSQSDAAHNASGGEVSRDEVPVALQGYVQQYFEEVRKAERAAGSTAKSGPATPKPAGSQAKPSPSEK